MLPFVLTCFPNEPAKQNDRDGDGVNDFEDTDDDDDGLSDDEEEDCDLDGFFDDSDDDDSECDVDGDEETGELLEVEPDNNETFVELDEEIEARFDCEIDESTVNATTFSVTSATDTITCSFDFSGSGEKIECEHDDDEFLPGTVYTATVDGVKCVDGTVVETESWSWTTDEN